MGRYTVAEILRRYQLDFEKDFEITDLKKVFFSKDEVDFILKENDRGKINNSDCIHKMLSILIYKQKNIRDFQMILKATHKWLSEKLDVAFTEEYTDTLIDIYRKACEESEIPKNRDLLVHRHEYIWLIQKELRTLNPGEYVILQGKIGFGKRWLACDACVDFHIMQKMDFQIYWLNVRKCTTPEKIFGKLNQLRLMLNLDEVDFRPLSYDSLETQIYSLNKAINKTLESPKFRNCLLVLSDVQDRQTLKAFKFKCKILVTTSFKDISDNISVKNKRIVAITHGFTELESIDLFTKALQNKNRGRAEDMPIVETNDVLKIHRSCKGNPFVMTLIAKDYMNEVITNTFWTNWRSSLDGYNLIKDEICYPINQIDLSLRKLDPKYRIWYESLVIFTDNVNIPVKVLQRYWNLTEHETVQIVNKFEKYSLLETFHTKGNQECSMHYLYYYYLKTHTDAETIKERHKKLVNSYRIVDSLENRKEPDLIDLTDDNYFHIYIGFHLREAEMLDVFPKLFLDFGFLEQKLRASQTPNTVGDLVFYRSEIAGNDLQSENRKRILDELIIFLPNIEEMMFKSRDTCLLQYAINDSQIALRNEALRQTRKFPNRVWFQDMDHSHKQRQIVHLPGKPHFVRMLDCDTALIALKDLNDFKIVLVDLSSNYTVESTFYSGHSRTIEDMQIFNEEYFISLDNLGQVIVWSIKNTPINNRRSFPEYATPRQPCYVDLNQPISKNDEIQKLVSNTNGKISCIRVSNKKTLFLGTTDGYIMMYKWGDSKFLEKTELKHNTNIPDLKSIICFNLMGVSYLKVLNKHGQIRLINLTTLGMVIITNNWTPYPNAIGMHCETIRDQFSHNIICVYKNHIICSNITNFQESPILDIKSTEIHTKINSLSDIVCSHLTEDSRYLFLGTVKGIFVLDRITESVIYRTDTSNIIGCLDVCEMDHSRFKFQLMICTERGEEIASLIPIPINQNSQFISECAKDENDINGEIDFGIFHNLKSDEIALYAVDTKNTVHKKMNSTNFSTSIENYCLDEKITQICCACDKVFIGCENGAVFLFKENLPIYEMSKKIEFLKCVDDVLIIGTDEEYCLSDNFAKKNSGFVKNCFKISKDYILIVKNDCSFEAIRISDGEVCYRMASEDGDLVLGACCLEDDLFLIGSIYPRGDENMYEVFQLETELNDIKTNLLFSGATRGIPITSVAISKDKLLFAIGFKNGIIEIYEIDSTNKSQKIDKKPYELEESRKTSINDLKFSQFTNINSPVILISISEQLCFWNIKYLQNNKIENSKKDGRQSSRFKNNKLSLKKSSIEDNLIRLSLEESNPWVGKIGASDKPELLSCIKLVGGSANKFFTDDNFTKFLTIDLEGNIYFLRFFDNEVVLRRSI